MTSVSHTIREELRALTRDMLALAVHAPFQRIRNDQGRLVSTLVPTEEQRLAASRQRERLHAWSRMVASFLRRRGCHGAAAIERCTADFEPYVLLSRVDFANVTEGRWRAAFAKEAMRVSLEAERVVEDNAGAFAVMQRPPLKYDDFDVHLSQADFTPPDWTSALAGKDVDAIAGAGQALFRGVFAPPLAESYARSREVAARSQRGLRIRLHLDGGGNLAGVPWEILHDGRDFLALSGETPIVRCIDGVEAPRRRPVASPLRILLTISAPRSFPPLDVKAERARVESVVAPLAMLGMAAMDVAPDGSLITLQRMLRSAEESGRPFHVWHFVGHGRFDEQTSRGDLVMTSDANEPRFAGGRELAALFKAHRDLRFASLNACEGARWQAGAPVSGVATALVEAGVPAVAAMQFLISDGAAVAFAEELYGALAGGAALESAVAEARRGIFFQPNPTEWITPVLFVPSRGGDEITMLSDQARE